MKEGTVERLITRIVVFLIIEVAAVSEGGGYDCEHITDECDGEYSDDDGDADES